MRAPTAFMLQTDLTLDGHVRRLMLQDGLTHSRLLARSRPCREPILVAADRDQRSGAERGASPRVQYTRFGLTARLSDRTSAPESSSTLSRSIAVERRTS